MAGSIVSSDADAIKNIIEVARLNENELKPVVQVICMSDQSQDDMILMQMRPDMLKMMSEGGSFVVRGEPGDPAVLCSKSSTYEVKEAETSNSLLLLPDLVFPDQCNNSGPMGENIVSKEVIGIFNKYYELKPCKPRLSKLRQLLMKCPYTGMSNEEEGEKYTLSDLLSLVQASEDELLSEIQNLHACEIDGYIRILDFDYKFRVVSLICDTVEAESIPWNKISKDDILILLEDTVPKKILEQCFDWYTYETDELGKKLYSLKEYDICHLYAEVLLRPTFMFNLQEFLQGWEESVPKGMKTELSQLEGLGIINVDTKPEVISYFPLWDLPDNVLERFSELFKKKNKWTYEEIEPYIRDLVVGTLDVKVLLAKHTRSSMSNGVRVYSSKW